MTEIKDSGERREFETGAVRDIQEGKGRCDLLPLDVVADLFNHIYSEIADNYGILKEISCFVNTGNTNHLYSAIYVFLNKYKKIDAFSAILDLSKHFEAGAKKYGERNWEKGIPTHCYIDSAVRHLLKHLRGDTDEPHDRAFVWNIVCCIWTCINKPELNDYANGG